MKMRNVRGRKRIAYASMAILAGTVIMLSVSPFLSVRFDVVLSGSMSPELNAGDLVIVTPASPSDLKVGDIIVFRSPFGGALVCHRIIAMEMGEDLTFQTKGDNNEDPDPFVVDSEDIVGKVQTCIPMIGHAVQWLRGPFGLLAIFALAAALLLPDVECKERTVETAKEDMDAEAQDSC